MRRPIMVWPSGYIDHSARPSVHGEFLSWKSGPITFGFLLISAALRALRIRQVKEQKLRLLDARIGLTNVVIFTCDEIFNFAFFAMAHSRMLFLLSMRHLVIIATRSPGNVAWDLSGNHLLFLLSS
ncbi:hypothetical protein QL093DRAFT_2090902 [Fusarium oxysporum]|nr:hypothetical protein QL093DRAFT_2090902 [Fusarium oxysporum]